MTQKMAHSDRLPAGRRIAKVFANRVIQIDLPFLRQHHDRGRRKLLAHRPRLKDGFGFDRHTMLQVGEAKTLSTHNFSVARNQDSQARDVLPIHFAFHVCFNCSGMGVQVLAQSSAC